MGMKWADAWQQLVYEHSPFKAVDDDHFQRLLRQLSELEKLFLTTPSRESVHVAAIQLQLMEDTFYSLRLDRYANAPDNRGWMNLFRQWSRSPIFRRHLAALATTFSRQFVEFYRHYIEDWPDDAPVPHPWDLRAARRTSDYKTYEGATKDAVLRCASPAAERGWAKGIFLDPGRVEAGSAGPYQEPKPVQPTQHGTPGDTTPGAPPAAPPPAPAPDSSKSTD